MDSNEAEVGGVATGFPHIKQEHTEDNINMASNIASPAEQQPMNVECNSLVVSPLENLTSQLSAKFEVDVNQIESVTLDDQAHEIQSLGLTVYDQGALERGIWDQVERETKKREAQEQLINVTTKLKLAEEQLKRVELPVPKKRSLLQDALEDPNRKRHKTSALKDYQETKEKQVKELRLKQARLQARLTGSKDSPDKDEEKQETERDRKIRMGEMTPFGTTISAASSDLSSFEKYLKSQQELHKKMMSGTSVKKKTKASSSSVLHQKSFSDAKLHKLPDATCVDKQSPSKRILKKHILFQKKRKGKEEMGTDINESEDNQRRLPGKLDSEVKVVDFEESGSEYVPSSEDDDDEVCRGKKDKSLKSSSKQEGHSTTSKRKGNASDRWAGGSLKRRKKRTKVLPDGDPDEWNSDDSDWLCTDDEDFGSDAEPGKKGKRHSKREADDGNDEDFYRRMKQWEKHNEGLQDQMEEDVHEFENGYKLPSIIWDKLYTYQQVGVRWMWELNQQRCGGILGDEMGLGKTIQIIAFLAGLSISKLKCRTTGYRGLGPSLIVCPTTVMHQWVRELHTWFPPLRVAILHESGSFIGKRSQLVRDMLHARGVIITSYTAVVRLKDYLLHQRWHYVILDEGHKIRNPDAQITLAVKQLRTPHRIILSGSPLQNNLRELWSLMDFVFPGKLGTLPVFMAEFAVPISQGGYSNASEVMVATAYKCATVLRDTIGPYLLRRMKTDVSDHIKLPAKNEQVLFCRLTDEQRDLYKAYLQCGEVGRILEGRCQIFVGLINLRKICNHPHLYSGGPKLFADEKEEDLNEQDRFGFWEKAGKMIVIEALLKMWQKQEHRVLIFTQSRQMLLILEKFVSDRGYRYLKLDGGTSIAARQPLINKFNEDKSYFLMLLTTKVGGLGVNLTGANRVVIYDPDWNPATDTQARERAWRIGQQSAVTVYRLITAGTIEEKMYHRQIFKQFLCNKVLKDPRQRRFFKSNDLLELFTLKETDDSTETAAIFAGTNSQVHVKPKPKQNNQKSVKDRKYSRHSNEVKERESHASPKSAKSVSKPEAQTKVNFSQDKLEHMKRLAHELSLKFSTKVAATAKETSKPSEESELISCTDMSLELCQSKEDVPNCSNAQSGASVIIEKEGVFGCRPKHDGELSGSNDLSESMTETTNEVSQTGPCTTEDMSLGSIPIDSDEDLENMKQLAQELRKELSKKVEAAASVNRLKVEETPHAGDEYTSKMEKNSEKDTPFEILSSTTTLNAPEDSRADVDVDASFILEQKLDNKPICETEVPSSQTSHPISEIDSCKESSPTQHRLESTATSSHRTESHRLSKTSKPSLDESPRRSKHKKHKKHKKHRRKDALFEGERIPGLVKASVLESKTKEDMDEEASHSSKQDDYVLRKLFAKTGIKTAMQHEKVMESGHADYALVEGEARRVAQDAVKALKASRQQCWTPMAGQPTWTGASGVLRPPQDGETRAQPSKPKFGKKKLISKKTAKDGISEKEEEDGSSSVLARIRARNLLLNEEDDENVPAGAPPPSVSDTNKELLDDIRTFVSFGASTDGRATTDEIVTQFRDRLPAQTSALFKQMLMQICEFHRLPSGQGVWKLIQDFQW